MGMAHITIHGMGWKSGQDGQDGILDLPSPVSRGRRTELQGDPSSRPRTWHPGAPGRPKRLPVSGSVPTNEGQSRVLATFGDTGHPPSRTAQAQRGVLGRRTWDTVPVRCMQDVLVMEGWYEDV